MNKFLKACSIALFFIFGSAFNVHANLQINEIMQSNVNGIMDDLNDFPDSWVELFNAGEAEENLGDYHIGLKKKIDKAYQLPDSIIQPGGYVLIYCDKAEKGTHTSFRLESNKEGEIYLFKNEEQIQKLEHPAFPAPDIAYGLDPETGEWGYEFQSSPGAENIPGICEADKILGNPVFSEIGGLKNKGFNLCLNLPEGAPEGTQIRFTLDGSTPTSESQLYTEGIEIEGTRIVRANLFCDGWLSPLPATQSYLFPDHEISLPVVSLVTDDSYINDSEIGIYVNFKEDWRRPVNIELFEHTDSLPALNQVGETRIAGNWSRNLQLKTLAVYSNKRFGEKRLDYEFFPETRPGNTNFKSLMLRNAGNDFFEGYMRDAVIHETVGNNMEIDFQAARPAVLFINGEYRGIINIRERSNEDNIFTNYNELEEIDMVENWSEHKEGDPQAINELISFFYQEDNTAEDYRALVDVKEYMDVHLAALYYNNCDFPGNNMVLWRPQENGLWRILMKDTDYGIGLKFGNANGNPSDYETLTWFHTPDYPGANNWGNAAPKTLLFRRLTSFPEIKEEFVNRALVYLGDFLNQYETISIIDKFYNQIKDEWFYHQNLYKNNIYGLLSPTSLQENVEYMKEWLVGRDNFFPQHFADFYGLGEMKELQVLQPDPRCNVKFVMNDIPLKTGKFIGSYPEDRKIVLKAEVEDDATPILGWDVRLFRSDSKRNVGESASSAEEDSDFEDTEEDEGPEGPDEDEGGEESFVSFTSEFEFVYPKGFSSVIITPVIDESYLTTDLSVVVVADNDDASPVEGIEVKAVKSDSTEEDAIARFTDSDGCVEFKGIDKGTYMVFIDDERFLFHRYETTESLILTEPDTLRVVLNELVVNPCNLDYEISEREDGLSDVDLSWEMEGFGKADSFFNYDYSIVLNEKECGHSSSTGHSIPGLSPGDYVVGIIALTPYGRMSDTLSVDFSISAPPEEADIEKVYGAEDEFVIFDLNGRRVSPANLAPGMYIRKHSDGKTEKFIKNSLMKP